MQGTLDLSKNTAREDITWYVSGGVTPVAGGSTGWRVLLGQFTVPTGNTLSGSFRVVGDEVDEYVSFNTGP